MATFQDAMTRGELFWLVQWHSSWTPSAGGINVESEHRATLACSLSRLQSGRWLSWGALRKEGRTASAWMSAGVWTSTIWWWWMRLQVNEPDTPHLSSPLGPNESLCTMDIKHPLANQPAGNSFHGKERRKCKMDWNKSFTLRLSLFLQTYKTKCR